MQYPFAWVYKKEGMPVEIVQEFEQWRKIRDADGSEGWVNAIMLSGRRTVLVRGIENAAMRDDHDQQGRLMAKVEPGVVASVKKCRDSWCQVTAGGYTGWMARNSLWGIYANEELN
jgi:SH3-like domain-containing protein